MASSLNASTAGGGGVIVTSDATGNLNIQSGGSTVVAVTSAGVAVTGTLSATGASTFTGTGKFATTIGVGNATPAASGSGITFPATQSASSDANTLDDYEEGTWTPVPVPGTGSITSYTSSGLYVKVGNTVIITSSIALTNAGTGAGGFGVSGLPFTPLDNAYGVIRETAATGTIYYVRAEAFSAVLSTQTATNTDVPVTTSRTYKFSLSYITS